MEQYTDEQLHAMLMELSVEEIQELELQFKKEYPNDRHYVTLCSIAVAIKTATDKQQAFVNLIQRMKNAPDGVGAPSQGNETR